jgi:hypothetical protein
VREAIEQKDWPLVNDSITRTSAALEREATLLKSAAKALGAN